MELPRTLRDLSLGTDGYRVTLGNWSKPLYDKLMLCTPVPPPAAAAKILSQFYNLSSEMFLQIWQMRSGLLGSPKAIPLTLSTRRPWFFAVRAGRTPGIYLSAKEASEQTLGFKHSQFKKFRCKIKAQAYIDAPAVPSHTAWTPGQLTIYTDGSNHPRRHRAGWGYVVVSPTAADAAPKTHHELHRALGRVTLDPTDPAFGGVEAHTNNTAELSAFLAALRWLDTQHDLMATITNVRVVTDSEYVRNLDREVWSPARNKPLVQTCQSLLRSVNLLLPVHILSLIHI